MSEETLPIRIAVDDPPIDAGATATGPVQPRERMVLVDVLRGFALLGILQVNFQNSSGTLSDLLDFFLQGSFYTTFSFLFGLGFAIQLMRAEEAKRPFIVRYLWRTVILLFIGIVHFVFFRASEILIEYALFAGFLLVVHRWRLSLILALALVWLVFSMSPRIPEGHVWTRINPEQVEAERLGAQLSRAVDQANPPTWCHIPGLSGAYSIEVCNNAIAVRRMLTHEITTVQWWKGWEGLMCMFLLGLYAGRRHIISDAARNTRLLAWVAGVALVFGLAGNALEVFGDFFADKGIGLPKSLDEWRLASGFGNIGLSLFYLAGITLLYTHRNAARRVLAPLAYVGRMGLTNFFMQPVMFITVLGYRGFDLMSGIEGWQNQLLLNSFFAVQILYSWWWFQHFRFGPVEWAWRSLTWFRVQPMRAKQLDET